MTIAPNRTPAGSPDGGKFAAKPGGSEADGTVLDSSPTTTEAWVNELKDAHGNVTQRIYYDGAVMHRTDGPALEVLASDGTVTYREYHVGGVPHRRGGGPAIEAFNLDGGRVYEAHWVGGHRHREGGPCERWFNEDGSVRGSEYWTDSVRHRTDGPALEWVGDDGNTHAEYWVSGEQMEYPDFLDYQDAAKATAQTSDTES